MCIYKSHKHKQNVQILRGIQINTQITFIILLQHATAIQMALNTPPAIQQLEIASVRRITKEERVIGVR